MALSSSPEAAAEAVEALEEAVVAAEATTVVTVDTTIVAVEAADSVALTIGVQALVAWTTAGDLVMSEAIVEASLNSTLQLNPTQALLPVAEATEEDSEEATALAEIA